MILNSQYEYRNVLEKVVHPGTRWLDVGCDRTILPEWMRKSVDVQRELVSRCELASGFDKYDKRPHVAGMSKDVWDVDELPYSNNSYNLITANMVLEHVENPIIFMREVHRVLAPRGKFVFHTPNRKHPLVFLAKVLPHSIVRRIASSLDARAQEDIFPTHYRLNTREDITSIPWFDVINIRGVPTQLFWRFPLIRSIESWLIRRSSEDRQSNWIVVMEK